MINDRLVHAFTQAALSPDSDLAVAALMIARIENPKLDAGPYLDRRTSIPITLALLYMEVARRAGLHVEDVNFPGHFLLRYRAERTLPDAQDLIIDAYHGGALMSRELRDRGLLSHHLKDTSIQNLKSEL